MEPRITSPSSLDAHDEATPDKTKEGAMHRVKSYIDRIFSDIGYTFLEQLQAEVPVSDLQREVEYLQSLKLASANASPYLTEGKTPQAFGLEGTEETADVVILNVATFGARLSRTKVIDGKECYVWVPRESLTITNDQFQPLMPTISHLKYLLWSCPYD
jgi:hypothetical protein